MSPNSYHMGKPLVFLLGLNFLICKLKKLTRTDPIPLSESEKVFCEYKTQNNPTRNGKVYSKLIHSLSSLEC